MTGSFGSGVVDMVAPCPQGVGLESRLPQGLPASYSQVAMAYMARGTLGHARFQHEPP